MDIKKVASLIAQGYTPEQVEEIDKILTAAETPPTEPVETPPTEPVVETPPTEPAVETPPAYVTAEQLTSVMEDFTKKITTAIQNINILRDDMGNPPTPNDAAKDALDAFLTPVKPSK